MGAEPYLAADLPLCSKLLGICDPGGSAPWCDQGWLDGVETSIALPSMGRFGL
jgi:hypothetical protein